MPEVRALWVGGSIAAGRADRYSDVDCGVALGAEGFLRFGEADLDDLFGSACVAHAERSFGDDLVLHQIVLDDAEIFDLLVWRASAVRVDEPVILLGCRDAGLRELLTERCAAPETRFAPAEPGEVREILVWFWTSSVKHRKALHRGLELAAQVGVRLQSGWVWRLLVLRETGLDPGDPTRQTIHGMTQAARSVRDADAVALLGASLESRAEIEEAVDRLHDAMSAVGRELAERLGFEYPHALETTTRRAWREFRAGA